MKHKKYKNKSKYERKKSKKKEKRHKKKSKESDSNSVNIKYYCVLIYLFFVSHFNSISVNKLYRVKKNRNG